MMDIAELQELEVAQRTGGDPQCCLVSRTYHVSINTTFVEE